MASFNKVILMGNLTSDPVHRVTPGGNSICKLGMAVNRKYKTKDGEEREEVTFVDVDAFGNTADTLNKYLRKGSPLFVEGRLKFEQWEADGQKRSKLGVILDKFEFMPTGVKNESAPKTESKPESPEKPAF